MLFCKAEFLGIFMEKNEWECQNTCLMQPDYNSSWHCRCSFTLASGRDITLTSLRQSITYEGLLEGVPFQRVNDRKISAMTDQVKQETGSVYVIPPVRRDFLRVPGDMANMGGVGIVPQWLPVITCVGCFDSCSPARDQTRDGSSLSILWFQDEFAMPIAPGILEVIHSMDWTSLAVDFDY